MLKAQGRGWLGTLSNRQRHQCPTRPEITQAFAEIEEQAIRRMGWERGMA